MKTQITVLVLGLSLCGLSAANSIRFSETLRDVRVCSIDEGERFCEVVTRDGGTITARLTIPGLRDLDITPDTSVEMNLGGANWSATWGDGRTHSSNRTVYVLSYLNDSDRTIVVGSLIFSRRGNVLNIVGATRRLESSFAAEDGSWDDNGRGSVDFSVDIGGLRVERTLYFKAVTTQRPPPTEEDEPLRTITVNGRADFKKPKVLIKTPRNRSRVTNDVLAVTGTATDNISVASVLYRVGSNDWFEADGIIEPGRTNTWSALVDLALGTNVVQVKSVDQESQESLVARRTIIRTP